MEFVKKYLVILISGVVALLALVGMVVGMSGYSSAQEKMDQAKGLLDKVKQVMRGVPVDVIEDGKVVTKNLLPTPGLIEKNQAVAQAKADLAYQAQRDILGRNIGLDVKTGKSKRVLISDGIFPKPKSESAYGFSAKYRQALADVLKSMQAGAVPTSKEIRKEYDDLDRWLGFHADPGDKSGRSGSSKSGKGGKSSKDSKNEEEESSSDGAGTTLDDTAKTNIAAQQAAMKKAQTIKVYADQLALDVVENAYEAAEGKPPTVDAMWWAQMSIWLQQDIASAIVDVNASAKNVLDSSVKRIVKIDIVDGIYQGAVSENSGYVGLPPQGEKPPESLSGVTDNPYFDSTAIRMELIIRADRVPAFIDAMYRQGDYLLYAWTVKSVEPSLEGERRVTASSGIPEEELYRYGQASVVRVTLWWETYLVKDFYYWGIIGYGATDEGKTFVKLYDGTKVEVPQADERKGVDGLKGLMPDSIRKPASGEQEDTGTTR